MKKPSPLLQKRENCLGSAKPYDLNKKEAEAPFTFKLI